MVEKNVVVGGSLNTWAQEWGSQTINARGRTVRENFVVLDVDLLNKRSQQPFNRVGVGSIIDHVREQLSGPTSPGEITGKDHEAI